MLFKKVNQVLANNRQAYRCFGASVSPKFPNEPAHPYMKSETFPGPEAVRIKGEIS